jgi:zinc protease
MIKTFTLSKRNSLFKIIAFLSLSLTLLLGAGFLSCSSGAARGSIYGGLGTAADPVPFMSEVRTGTLPNGLRYYILENSRPENRAFLTLAVNAGSVLEQDDERGLAHFVEHMAFNGTARFPESELVKYLQSLGMRFGPEVNAYTSFDETVYGIEVPVETGDDGLKRIPGKALDVLDDWTHAITFAPADVDDERRVIMEEYRSRLGAMERIQRKMIPVIFRGSPYAERLPIGLPEIIQNAPASRLEGFYKTWYRPDNMALILVGDFDGAVLERELASHFTAPRPDTALDHPVYELPEPEKNRLQVEIYTDPEYPNTRIDLYYKLPRQSRGGDLAAYRESLIGNLIDRMLSLRFEEASANQENPYTDAGSAEIRYGKESGYYIMVAIAKPGAGEASLTALLREKESISRYGFTGAEIDRAKRSLLSDLRRQVSEKDRQHSNAYINAFTVHFLQERLCPDIEWELDASMKLLPGISSKDIAAAAKAYFAAGDLTVMVTAPEADAAGLPGAADIRRMDIRRIVAESRRARIPRPKEAPKAAAGVSLLDETPISGFIATESEDPESGTIRWELDNGAVVILKETSNRNNEIIFYALARGGIIGVPPGDIVSAKLAAEMATASGSGPYSRTELIKKLADKQVSISFWINTFYRGFQGSATVEDLETFFELLHLGFTGPRMDSGAVGALLDQYRTDLAQRNENPEAVFIDELSRTIFSNNPYYKPLEASDLSRVDTNTSLAFVRRALNPADYTFVFTGNLDIPALRNYAETYLASIPRGETWNTWTDPNIQRPGKTEKTVYKGKEEKSLVFLAWFLPEPYSESGDAAASVLTEYLDIRLTEEIRESLGGVYSVSADASLSVFPPDGELVMQVFFACDPRRAAELSAAIQEEIRRIAEGSIDGETFTKAALALGKTHEESMQSNLFIARNLANYSVMLNMPLSRLDRRPELYSSVTAADIQDIVQRFLQNGPVEAVLYPEGWK